VKYFAIEKGGEMRRGIAAFTGGILLFASLLGVQMGSHATENNVETVVPARQNVQIPKSVYRIKTKDKVAFITIDDGIYKTENSLAYVKANKLPITAFLSAWTIKNSMEYFNEFTQWGSVQNHSATHASFAKKSTDLNHEICYVQKRFGKQYDWYPWMLRPPYGAGQDSQAVRKMGEKCGIQQIVMWDASVGNGKISYADSKLRPGSIVLMHFSKSLKKDLKLAVKKIREAGLEPANLDDYLPRVNNVPTMLSSPKFSVRAGLTQPAR
jgi:peptidoglycan/xylan/chitin deacetylase (PgdA/CDA1 family)